MPPEQFEANEPNKNRLLLKKVMLFHFENPLNK